MAVCAMQLPCPPIVWRVAVPANADAAVDVSSLPHGPGLFILEDASGGTLGMAVTADLRRRVRERLVPLDESEGPTRRIDFRRLTRTVLALPVGSAFEADWAYLQHARQRLPGAAKAMAERGRAWFVHCSDDAAHPRWTKTPTPGSPPQGCGGSYFGPIPDKHAAHRYVEAIIDAFDLCRYHHILVQAPHGAACAYKEMGRCPAPCDGTVTMDAYLEQVREALRFAGAEDSVWRREMAARMRAFGAALQFEQAEAIRRRLEVLEAASGGAFVDVAPLHALAYLAVMPSERQGYARVFLVRGGWIAPVADLTIDADEADAAAVLEACRGRASSSAWRDDGNGLDAAALDNLSIVMRHRFPGGRRVRPSQRFVRLSDALTSSDVCTALTTLRRGGGDDVAEAFTDGDAPARR